MLRSLLLLLLLSAGCDSAETIARLESVHEQHHQRSDTLHRLLEDRDALEERWQAVMTRVSARRAEDPGCDATKLTALVAQVAPDAEASAWHPDTVIVKGPAGSTKGVVAMGRIAQASPKLGVSQAAFHADGSWELTLHPPEAYGDLSPSRVLPPLDDPPPPQDLRGGDAKRRYAEIVILQQQIGVYSEALGSLLQVPLREELFEVDDANQAKGDRMKRASWVVEGMLGGEAPPLSHARFTFLDDRVTFAGPMSPDSHIGMVAIGTSWWVIETIEDRDAEGMVGQLRWKPLEGQEEPPAAARLSTDDPGWVLPAWAETPSP